ncbi:ATP-binding protein [Pseudomonas helleri]|jgi:two-component system capsular synthesis sensor histidine kinase RcsC|uniref:ATP-binding protein n=1 Tax=Pseudomonas helleri TaxID=1608996 RepID=UPI001295BF74|nr:ATP-binding protein [Pseudomonas helleri]MQT35877.1 response regulator [Pseudomonas helleri]MQU21363.1 response regulator [Pseudomonas helleri]
MKLKQFIRPFDASFSTPKAARKLLHLFAIALTGGVIAIAFSYVRTTLNDEISARRSDMNQGVAEAQLFFVSREMLLKSLVLSAVSNVTQPIPNNNEVRTEEVHIVLGDSRHNWSLWLTNRMRDYLRQHQVNLLYVLDKGQPTVTRLFNVTSSPDKVPDVVLRQLMAQTQGDFSLRDDVWLRDASLTDSPLYAFSRLDDRVLGSGWLGLEVQVPDMVAALHHEGAGDFMLLDGRGNVLFSSSAEPVGNLRHQLQAIRSFGFIGTGLFPEKLAIRKRMDYSDWQIVYALNIKSLLPVLAGPLLVSTLLCSLFAWLMLCLVRRIDRRLITPANDRIEGLIESEAFSRTVIHIAPVALCVLRRVDGSVVLENSLAQQWLGAGHERNQLSRDWIKRAFEDVEQNTTDEFEMADGRHLYLSFAPTRYKREDVLICAFSDISAHKQVELALEQARQSADSANEAKSLFLATMSHEIRTPLYGVLGTLELLGRTELNRQQQNYLQAIEGSSANLLQLICDVLDVSKIEAGQLSLTLNRFSPVELIQGVVQSYAGAAHAKGVQLFACIDPKVPDWLNGDASRIRQILNNLLNNALKFTDHGRIILRLKLDSRDDERVTLNWQVSDTGKGISLENQRFLFEPFYQASGSTNVVAGTGLGLSICKRLMHLMNGSMRVVSEPGLGSSFTLQLPLEQLNAQPTDPGCQPLLAETVYVVATVRELAENFCGWLNRWGARAEVRRPGLLAYTPGAVLLELHVGAFKYALVPGWQGQKVIAGTEDYVCTESSSNHRHVNLNDLSDVHHAVSEAQGQSMVQINALTENRLDGHLGIHVLVAEDNVINQLILRDQLEDLGCTVELAGDGQEALALWRATPFDLVLTDVNMPRMNGYELAARLRELNSTIPIIGATANAMLEEADRCRAAGMNQCLIKPFSMRALYTCLLAYKRNADEAL